jgi:ribosome biogenesis GTPase A
LAGRSAARTGDRPGVTRDKQWIKINSKIHFLDTPGILWPKFEDRKIGMNLALTGAIKDEIMDINELATKLLEYIACNYKGNLEKRYNIATDGKAGHELLVEISFSRGHLAGEGEPDTFKTSQIVLDEFRGGIIGRMSLEEPVD